MNLKTILIFLSIVTLYTNILFCQKAKMDAKIAELVPQFMRVPNAIDLDGNGIYSTEEVQLAPQSLVQLDLNKDGEIDWKEMGAWEELMPLIRDHNITNLIDANGDIHISAEEILHATDNLKILDQNNDWLIDSLELRVSKGPAPIFSNKNFTLPEWMSFRGYTTKQDGDILPGSNRKEYKAYTFIHDAGDWGLRQMSNETYLLDENGKKVHEWKHNGYSPEASVAYLLPNGQLLRTYSKHQWVIDKYFPVGATSTVELVDWDGNVLWDYDNSIKMKYSLHHDVEYLPSGNILAIRFNGFTIAEAEAMGWNSDLGKTSCLRTTSGKKVGGMVWMSNILELKPNLEDGSTEIVWEWNSWDHLVQDTYPDKSNYGDATNPGKLHINYLNLDKDIPYNSGQFFHLNTVSYNAEKDLILLSSPSYGEIWIIDHSTTMDEAASSEGGQFGKGGDILYRYGNPSAYGTGTRSDGVLFWQHEADWIGEGLEGAGNILIFNNGNRRRLDNTYMEKPEGSGGGVGKSYSQLLEIKPKLNKEGYYDINQPTEIVWLWQDKNKQDFYSPFMSGAQRLPNGNTLFCTAYNKFIHEVTEDDKKVLDYSLKGWGRLYRIYKYDKDYSGLKFD